MIVLVDETRRGVDVRLKIWKDALEGCSLSRSKTEYMEHMFSTSRNQDEGIVKLDGEEIPKIECFQYLGSIIHKGGPLYDCRIPSKLKGKIYKTA